MNAKLFLFGICLVWGVPMPTHAHYMPWFSWKHISCQVSSMLKPAAGCGWLYNCDNDACCNRDTQCSSNQFCNVESSRCSSCVGRGEKCAGDSHCCPGDVCHKGKCTTRNQISQVCKKLGTFGQQCSNSGHRFCPCKTGYTCTNLSTKFVLARGKGIYGLKVIKVGTCMSTSRNEESGSGEESTINEPTTDFDMDFSGDFKTYSGSGLKSSGSGEESTTDEPTTEFDFITDFNSNTEDSTSSAKPTMLTSFPGKEKDATIREEATTDVPTTNILTTSEIPTLEELGLITTDPYAKKKEQERLNRKKQHEEKMRKILEKLERKRKQQEKSKKLQETLLRKLP
eukprot:m.242883 g.242883  ORF g.242883 m.242883 type:complete len:341 (+) comp40229_c2_seq14:1705-2727(+)